MTTTPEVVLAGDAGAKPPSFMPNGPLVRIHANLMPDEIIIARRLHRLQRRLGAGVIALAILLGGGYGYSRYQTGQATDELESAKAQGAQLTSRESAFNPLVQLQSKTSALQTQLQGVMTDDLEWNGLLGSINRAANGQISVDDVTGSAGTGSTTGGTTTGSSVAGASISNSSATAIGELTLTGKAPTLTAVAAFVQRLDAIKGFTDVLPADTSAGDKGSLDYTINITLTSDILGGRFSKATGQTNGSATTPSTGSTTGGR